MSSNRVRDRTIQLATRQAAENAALAEECKARELAAVLGELDPSDYARLLAEQLRNNTPPDAELVARTLADFHAAESIGVKRVVLAASLDAVRRNLLDGWQPTRQGATA